MDNYKIEKFKWVCMEDSIGCKIGNFQTESIVIMLHKHSNKSVLFKLFHLLSTNPKLISQYRLTYTLYSGLNHVISFYNIPPIISVFKLQITICNKFRKMLRLIKKHTQGEMQKWKKDGTFTIRINN